MRNAVTGLVFEKALRLSHAGKSQSTTGEIVNLMSADSEKLAMCIGMSTTQSIFVPFNVGVIIWLIYRVLGASTFAGLGVLVFTTSTTYSLVCTHNSCSSPVRLRCDVM